MKFKEIDKLVRQIDSIETRIFQYKLTDQNKFYHFVELILKDDISEYISSEDRLNLFYSDFDRRSGKEWMDQMRFETFPNKLKHKRTLELPNGKKIDLVIKYNYYYSRNYSIANSSLMGINYFIHKKGKEKLIMLDKYKRFRKSAVDYFDDCSKLIDVFDSKQINYNNTPEINEFYKSYCK